MEATNTNILQEISNLTLTIEKDYPELQKYLDESRSSLPQGAFDNSKMDAEELINYRDSLKELIDNYNKQKA